MTKEQELKEWHKVGISTAKAIKDIVSKWYADCYNNERDMQRLMIWESHINKLLRQEKRG